MNQNEIKHDEDGFLIGKQESQNIQNTLDNTEKLLSRAQNNKPVPVVITRAPKASIQRVTPMQRRQENLNIQAKRENQIQTKHLEVIAKNSKSQKNTSKHGLLASLAAANALKNLAGGKSKLNIDSSGKIPSKYKLLGATAAGVAGAKAVKDFKTPDKTRPRDANGRFLGSFSRANKTEYKPYSPKGSEPKKGFLSKLGRFGKLGGLMAAGLMALNIFDIERSDMTRQEKNQAHARNAGTGLGALAGAKLGAMVGSVVPVVGTIIGAIVGGILGGFGGRELVDNWNDWLGKIIPSSFSQSILSSWNGFTNWVGQLWRDFTHGNATQLWTTFVNGISDAWTSLSVNTMQWASDLWQKIAPESWQNFMNQTIGFAQNAWINFSSFIAPYWETVQNFASNAWDGIKKVGEEAWATVAQFGQKLWEGFKNSELGKAFLNSAEWVGDKVSSGAEWVKEKVQQGKDAITQSEPAQWFADKAEKGKEVVKQSIDTTTEKVQNAKKSVTEIGGKIWEAGKEKAKKAINATQEVFQKSSEVTAKAAKYTLEHALPKSAGRCAEFVNNGLQAQGLKVWGHGKDVADNLIKNNKGFEAVEYSKDYIPKHGDVMSIDHKRHKYGHVAIYNAEIGKWVSDFVQHNKRGNTAAASNSDYQSILSGKAKVTIARKTDGEQGYVNARKVKESIQNTMDKVIPKAHASEIDSDSYPELGHISNKYETGGRGAGVISTGKGDKGGVSYGTYQLSSKMGTLQKFLQSSGYDKHFSGLAVNSEAFKQKWKDLATNDPNFAKAQHDFIKQTHYNPQLNHLQKAGLGELANRGQAVQEAIFSTSVQFGGANNVIKNALSGKNLSSMSDADIVSAIQDYKIANNTSLFRSSSSKVQQGTLRRAKSEKMDLVNLANSNRIQNAPNAQVASVINNPPTIPKAKTVKTPSVQVNAVKTPAYEPKSSNTGRDDMPTTSSFGSGLAHQPSVSRTVGNKHIAHVASGGIMTDYFG